MSKNIYRFNLLDEKSRSDSILLTRGFNLRSRRNDHLTKVLQGLYFISKKCRPLRDFDGYAVSQVRRLKSTVNKMSSLRDFIFDDDILLVT